MKTINRINIEGLIQSTALILSGTAFVYAQEQKTMYTNDSAMSQGFSTGSG